MGIQTVYPSHWEIKSSTSSTRSRLALIYVFADIMQGQKHMVKNERVAILCVIPPYATRRFLKSHNNQPITSKP